MLYYTNYNEAVSYIKVIPIKIPIGLLFLLFYTIYILRIDYDKFFKKYYIPILCIVLGILPIKKVLKYGLRWYQLDKYFNVQPIKRTVSFVGSMYMVKNELERD